MNLHRSVIAILLVAAVSYASTRYSGSEKDRDSLRRTSEAIRDAFARGDVSTVMAYHHPDVIKALSPDKYLEGREAVRADLAASFQQFRLEFIEHRVENLYFQGNTAVEQSAFTIRGTPKGNGQPFLFKGRALVVYVRYNSSPTGWASIRELVQPAP